MSIKTQIMDDLKTAMKAREMELVSTLRLLQSALKNKEIDLRPNEPTEEDYIAVLKKNAKQRKESISQFKDAGRDDLAQNEENELKIIEKYLPELMSEDQVKAVVTDVIAETGAASMKDMGKVMQAVLAKTGGQADNKMVSQFVKEALQG